MATLHNTAFETLFDPSSPSGSTASANSYLSFSALADSRNHQDLSGLQYLEKWQTGSQRSDMDEALLFSNPSPFTYSSSGQTDTGMSPWALSPAYSASSDAGIPSLPLPRASCSSLSGFNDVLFPEIDLLDAVDPYDCTTSYPPINMSTRNPSLVNKASNESMLSAASGTTEFLLTPRHSMNQMNHGWDDLAVLPGSSCSSVGYVDRIKDSRSGSSSSAWSGGISLDMEATNYGDMKRKQGTFPIGAQDFGVTPLTETYTVDAVNPGFVGQNLDWVIEQHQEAPTTEKKRVDENGQLLPPACIVGNVAGWQSSSPTYPSLLEFDNASAPDNLINFRTEPLLNVVTPSRPVRPASTGPSSSVGLASGAMLGAPMSRISRSSHGVDGRNTSSLFAFHPIDHSSAPAKRAAAGPSTLPEPVPFYQPQQFLTPSQPSGLANRRSVGGLSIQTSMLVPGSDMYSNPYNTSTSTVSNMIPPYVNTAPLVEHIPFDSRYDAMAGPMSAPLYPSYDTMLPMTPVRVMQPSPVAAPASVLQPAPGNINVAPPLSVDLPPPVVAVEVPTPRASSHKHVDVQPVLTSAPLILPTVRPDTATPTRTVAALPSKRKVSAPKPRKPSGKKATAPKQPFCSFINFTADDAVVISAGVAPSGSKNKRKAEDGGSPTDSNKRSRPSDSP